MASTPSVRRALRPLGFVSAAAAFCALAPSADAQLNNQWVSFTKTAGKITSPIVPPTELSTEIDVHWNDLDKDGWVDLVGVRKQDFTSTGKRVNLLLMNENGVLVDRTQLRASAADVPGDQGFVTATNDRDVQIADFDNDGWLDFVTATTLSDGDPKHIGHPRIYMNRGNDGGGNWLGMRFENARFPQMFSFSNGSAQNPRFCSVAFGDVTNNGFNDLYFGDYDSSGAGGAGQPAGADMNNRLMINNGAGFFTDQSQARMTPTMLLSAFGAASEIHDMNLNGLNDVIKQTSLNPPQHVAVVYNNPANPGFFNIYQDFSVFAPYHIDVADLNNDGRLDIIITDDGADRWRLNTGTDGLGRVIWGNGLTFSFLSGGDDGFGSNNLLADLDMDGWNDVLIADVDVDIGGYGRRLHIYHNTGTVPGAQPVIREERQSNTGNQGSGWIGVLGMNASDMVGTHDVAVFDLDNDGDNDMVVFRRTVSEVWVSNVNPVVCQENLGSGGPGSTTLAVCGQPLFTGQNATLTVAGAPAFSPLVLLIGVSQTALPIFGGTVITIPAVTLGAATNGAGQFTLPINNNAGSSADVFLQTLVFDPSQPSEFQISNGVKVDFKN